MKAEAKANHKYLKPQQIGQDRCSDGKNHRQQEIAWDIHRAATLLESKITGYIGGELSYPKG